MAKQQDNRTTLDKIVDFASQDFDNLSPAIVLDVLMYGNLSQTKLGSELGQRISYSTIDRQITFGTNGDSITLRLDQIPSKGLDIMTLARGFLPVKEYVLAMGTAANSLKSAHDALDPQDQDSDDPILLRQTSIEDVRRFVANNRIYEVDGIFYSINPFTDLEGIQDIGAHNPISQAKLLQKLNGDRSAETGAFRISPPSAFPILATDYGAVSDMSDVVAAGATIPDTPRAPIVPVAVVQVPQTPQTYVEITPQSLVEPVDEAPVPPLADDVYTSEQPLQNSFETSVEYEVPDADPVTQVEQTGFQLTTPGRAIPSQTQQLTDLPTVEVSPIEVPTNPNIDDYEAQIADLESQLNSYRHTNAILSSNLETYQTALENAEDRVTELTIQLVNGDPNLHKKIKTLEAEVETYLNDAATAVDELIASKLELSKLTTEYGQLSTKHDNLIRRQRTQIESHKNLKNSLADLKQTKANANIRYLIGGVGAGLAAAMIVASLTSDNSLSNQESSQPQKPVAQTSQTIAPDYCEGAGTPYSNFVHALQTQKNGDPGVATPTLNDMTTVWIAEEGIRGTDNFYVDMGASDTPLQDMFTKLSNDCGAGHLKEEEKSLGTTAYKNLGLQDNQFYHVTQSELDTSRSNLGLEQMTTGRLD